MRIVIRQVPLHEVLRSAQRASFAVALLLLGYCAFELADGWIFQARTNRTLDLAVSSVTASLSPDKPAAIGFDGVIGRIEIPSLRLSVVVAEGVSGKTLRRAAGHVPGTALPGEPGNVGISAHRDTFFRPLKDIRANDIITLTTPVGKFHYRVVSTKIVSPSDVAVLDRTANQVLTLVTCYPFYFVGSAPDRFIVRAERIT